MFSFDIKSLPRILAGHCFESKVLALVCLAGYRLRWWFWNQCLPDTVFTRIVSVENIASFGKS